MSALPIFRNRARTFWFATRFLPADSRASVNQLYAFARVVDDLVDEPTSLETEEKRSTLMAWHAWLGAAVSAEHAPDPRLARQVQSLLADNRVPGHYLQLLVEGVASDLNRQEMASWPELREYCFKVASSVGLAMCHLLGAATIRSRGPRLWTSALPCN